MWKVEAVLRKHKNNADFPHLNYKRASFLEVAAHKSLIDEPRAQASSRYTIPSARMML